MGNAALRIFLFLFREIALYSLSSTLYFTHTSIIKHTYTYTHPYTPTHNACPISSSSECLPFHLTASHFPLPSPLPPLPPPCPPRLSSLHQSGHPLSVPGSVLSPYPAIGRSISKFPSLIRMQACHSRFPAGISSFIQGMNEGRREGGGKEEESG